MFNFEKLDVWQKGIEFADLIYADTRTFPTEERFGLTACNKTFRNDFEDRAASDFDKPRKVNLGTS